MKKSLLLILAVFPLLLIAQQEANPVYVKEQPGDPALMKLSSQRGEKQYITQEQIRLCGAGRLSDLLVYIDKWMFASVNTDRYYVAPNGLGNYMQQDYILMVNGQKVELNRMDALNINLLGISVTDIARVEIINTPQLFEGQFNSKGLINIITRNDYKGLSYRVYLNQGNVSGDPAPLRYTPYASPNIDKVGLNYTHSLGYFGKKWHINTSFVYQDFYARDTAIAGRYHLFKPGATPIATLKSVRSEAAFAWNRTLIKVNGAYSNNNEYVFSPVNLSEIPSHTEYMEAGFQTKTSFSDQRSFQTHVNYSSHHLGLWENPSGISIGMQQQYITANMQYESRKTVKKDKKQTWIHGFTFEQYHLLQASQTRILSQYKPYSSFSYPVSRKAQQTFQAMLAITDHYVNPKLVFKHDKRVSNITSWTFNASWSRQSVDETPGFYDAALQNFQLQQITQPASYIFNRIVKQNDLFLVDYIYQIAIGNNFKLNINPGFRYHAGIPSLQFNTQQNWTNQNLATPFVFDRADAWTTTFGANVRYDVVNNMVMELDYFSSADASDALLKPVITQDARRKFSATFTFKLPKRFHIWIRTQSISKTSWNNFAPLNPDSSANFKTSLPSVFTTDIGISKQLWGNGIAVTASVRNLFNQFEQYHPMGAQMPLRLFVNVQIMLDDILRKSKKP